VTDRKPATAPEYMAPREGPRDPVTRQTLALALIIVPTLAGALALYWLGTDRATLKWVAGVVTCFGALGGWVHHPVRRFRVRGALAGVLAAGGALLATYLYVGWRGGDQKVRLGEDLIIPLVVGAAPGAYIYYSLLRDERVAPWEETTNTKPS
jgi:hypothetical protein